MPVLEIAAGLLLLLGGGELLVRGAVGLARQMGISPLIIGLTLVGFGTSMPELVTSVQAALIGAPGIAIGNVVGSNIANVLLILGLSALIWPLACPAAAIRRDGTIMMLASGAMLAIVLSGALGRIQGALLLAGLVGFLVLSWRAERTSPGAPDTASDAAHPRAATWWGIKVAALSLLGLAILVLGAQLLVGGAVTLAEKIGLSQTVIGLTLVAVGTSLPELATSLVAAWRRHGDIVLGNIIGSNIFNILGIAGITALVEPLVVPGEIVQLDIWVMLIAASLLMVFGLLHGCLQRRHGALLLGGYGLYLGWLVA